MRQAKPAPDRSAWFATAGLVAVLGASALGASGCGRVGPLEQPAPLFGARAKAEYYAQRQAQADQAAQRSAAQRNAQGSAERQPDASGANGSALGNTTGDPNADDAPLTTRDVQDPETKLTTPRDSPVPGAPNPLGPTPSVTPQAR